MAVEDDVRRVAEEAYGKGVVIEPQGNGIWLCYPKQLDDDETPIQVTRDGEIRYSNPVPF